MKIFLMEVFFCALQCHEKLKEFYVKTMAHTKFFQPNKLWSACRDVYRRAVWCCWIRAYHSAPLFNMLKFGVTLLYIMVIRVVELFDPYPPPVGNHRHSSKMSPLPFPKKTSASSQFSTRAGGTLCPAHNYFATLIKHIQLCLSWRVTDRPSRRTVTKMTLTKEAI